MTEIERLRAEYDANPTRKHALRLANELYGSENHRDWGEAIKLFREARDSLDLSGQRFGITPCEGVKLASLGQRIRDRLAGRMELPDDLANLPGMHRELDSDRNYMPRDVGKGWDKVGTHKMHEAMQPLVPGAPFEGQLPGIPGTKKVIEVEPEPLLPGQIVMPDGRPAK